MTAPVGPSPRYGKGVGLSLSQSLRELLCEQFEFVVGEIDPCEISDVTDLLGVDSGFAHAYRKYQPVSKRFDEVSEIPVDRN